jgi:hypothetical protein
MRSSPAGRSPSGHALAEKGAVNECQGPPGHLHRLSGGVLTPPHGEPNLYCGKLSTIWTTWHEEGLA